MDKIYILSALSTSRNDGFAAEQESDNVSNGKKEKRRKGKKIVSIVNHNGIME